MPRPNKSVDTMILFWNSLNLSVHTNSIQASQNAQRPEILDLNCSHKRRMQDDAKPFGAQDEAKQSMFASKLSFALLVSRDAIFLAEARVDRDAREVAFNQKLVKSDGTLDRLHEDHHLVELQCIQEIVQLSVLLLLCELHIIPGIAFNFFKIQAQSHS